MTKVALLNRSDAGGGAARAAYRIHSALRGAGLDSRLQVGQSHGSDYTVFGPASRIGRIHSLLAPACAQLIVKAACPHNPALHSPAVFSTNSAAALNCADVDVINLHWVNDEMISVREIGRLRKPVVWTLHDMWPFCGAEHYSEDGRWRDGYSATNRPDGEQGFDLNRWVWLRKRKHWQTPMHIVTPSRWLANCVRQSMLMCDWPISIVPNAIDTDVWRPSEMGIARELLQLPAQAKLLLFGAMGGGRDPRKGFDLLLSALRFLRGRTTGVELVVLGQNPPANLPDIGLPVHYVGHLQDDISLRLLYGAVDLVAIPSRQDNLPNIGVESIACGTPVVAFDTGGLPDIVTHGKTGYLAPAFDTEDFARGIEWMLSDPARLAEMATCAREDAIARFSYPVVAASYQQIFEQVIRAKAECER